MGMKLTGHVRYRTQRMLFKRNDLVVVQVEVSGTAPEYAGGHVSMEDKTIWRDARVEDIVSLMFTPGDPHEEAA